MISRLIMFLKLCNRDLFKAFYLAFNGLFFKKVIKNKIYGHPFYQNNDKSTIYHLIHSFSKIEDLVKAIPEEINGEIIDAGANNGIFSLLAAKKFPQVRIHSIEPSPILYPILKKNFKGMNVEIHKMALAEKSGKIKLFISSNSDQISSAQFENIKPFEKDEKNILPVEVDSISMEDFILRNKISKISVLKMDIQGGEYDILKGSETLFKITEILLIEVILIDPTVFKLLDLLKLHFPYFGSINPVVSGADLIFSKNKLSNTQKIY